MVHLERKDPNRGCPTASPLNQTHLLGQEIPHDVEDPVEAQLQHVLPGDDADGETEEAYHERANTAVCGRQTGTPPTCRSR